ncbi:DNA replication/repair protein RecF [Candidatus Margulisiibacteriota bacterium]
MLINTLRLKDFRNIKEVAADLSPGTTIFYGGIGEGKTNLIEAIYLLSIGRSHRTSSSSDMIYWGSDEAAVKGEGESGTGKLSTLVKIKGERKKVEVNGASCGKTLDLLGNFRSVLFHSEDLKIVKDDPSFRRKFLDIVISQVSKNYAYSLRDYYKALRQKNHALAGGVADNADIWDEQLASLGAWITEVRAKTIKEMGSIAARMFTVLIGEDLQLSLGYSKSAPTDKVEYMEKLKQAKPFDVARGRTSLGPHRDDIEIKVNGKSARQFASSGEQKVIMLSLKMAEVEFIKGMTGEEPLLLLDDVFSSIDERRSKALLGSTGNGSQCIITTTDLNSVQRDLLRDAKLYEVKDGGIKGS